MNGTEGPSEPFGARAIGVVRGRMYLMFDDGHGVQLQCHREFRHTDMTEQGLDDDVVSGMLALIEATPAEGLRCRSSPAPGHPRGLGLALPLSAIGAMA